MFFKSTEFRDRLEKQIGDWGLPTSLAAEFARHLTPVTYEKDSILFLRGSPAQFLFCVVSGFVKIYFPHNSGARTLVAIARAGDILGIVDGIDTATQRYQVLEAHALTKCSIGLIPREHVAKLLGSLDPGTIIHLLEHINTTWSRQFEWYAALMGVPFRQRLQMVFEDLRDRVGVADRRGTLLLPSLTHDDLAEMIGSSRPMVSRLISEMVEDGFLVPCGKRHYVIRTGTLPAHLSRAADGTTRKEVELPRCDGLAHLRDNRGWCRDNLLVTSSANQLTARTRM